MALRIALNGFGRIGRYLTRLLAHQSEVELVAINARGDNESLARLLKYDSVHGRVDFAVDYNEQGLIVNGKEVLVTRQKTNEWLWKDLDIDIVVETTGSIKNHAGLTEHINCGAKKVIMSAPAEGADVTIVMGVNHDDLKPEHKVISSASCTTNCLAPATMIMHEAFGISHALMTTVHSYTMSQRVLDGTHKDARRGRACAMSLIPTTTGAARAIGIVYPELKGKIDGMAIRVPLPNVSLVDITMQLQKDTTVEEVNKVLKEAALTRVKGNMGFCEEPLVSIDYTGMTEGGVIDGLSTMVSDKSLVKLIIWYDNEAGFTNQLLRLINHVGNVS